MIKDSGTRDTFSTGAVRDGEQGKGRFDLLPLYLCDVLAAFDECTERSLSQAVSDLLCAASAHKWPEGHRRWLQVRAACALLKAMSPDAYPYGGVERVARVYEAGAAKYDARNWERGIPTYRYYDSGLRHLMKHLAGRDDEDHCAMALWNVLGLIETEARIVAGELPDELWTMPYQKGDL